MKCFVGWVAVAVLILASASQAMSAGLPGKTLTHIVPETEFGKQGSCQTSGYVSTVPGSPVPYLGKAKLPTAQKIGVASVAEIAAAQQNVYRPYAGIGFLPESQTLPEFTPPTDGGTLYRINCFSGGRILSGLVVVPTTSIANGVVVYEHSNRSRSRRMRQAIRPMKRVPHQRSGGKGPASGDA